MREEDRRQVSSAWPIAAMWMGGELGSRLGMWIPRCEAWAVFS